MKTKTVVQFCVAALIFVAALVLVLVGVLSHEEPTFNEELPEWGPSAPLKVSLEVDNDTPLSAYEHKALQDALAYFPRGVFTVATQDSDVSVVLHLPTVIGGPEDEAMPLETDDIGKAWVHLRGNRISHCTVKIRDTVRNLTLTIAHELGHCLGLVHDESDSSLMTRGSLQADIRGTGPRLSDLDRKAVRDRYLP